ncbi:MAG: EFR1 family ferrodoxin [Candidatus Omnitrophota bacterium]
MKTVIFYFSGTGNCLKVAQDIAAGLKDTEIIAIPKVIDESEISTKANNVGIIYPVYMFGMPLILSRFIKKLKFNSAQYIFSVATYGGMMGSTLIQTKRELKKQGIKLSAGFGIKMPGNYTPLYGALPLDKQEKMFAKENEKIKLICEIVKASKEAPIEKGLILENLLLSGIIYNVCSPQIPSMDKSFWVNDKCNSCGICQKVCPVKNIKIVDAKPAWLGKCEQCMACLQWCPKEAIQYGKRTIGRKRYHHPQISLDDIIF